MSGRGEIACYRCKELKRKDKLVIWADYGYLCKHCRAVIVYKLRELEKVALLSD